MTDPGISEPGYLANPRHLVCLILRLGITLLSYMIEMSQDLTFVRDFVRFFSSDVRDLSLFRLQTHSLYLFANPFTLKNDNTTLW